ncbi:MAG TPA: response regulator [Chlorobiota bacterium]|nr:response regulator [Chlorobiota bacterium]
MTTSMQRPLVLVVDDNKITTKLMRRYLEANGFDSDEAGDGMECLERVAQRRPDAIILDVMMPRLDGFETVKMLKADAATAQIPVAIVTALNDSATQVKAVEAGADDFLTKPIEERLLITKAHVLTSLGIERRRIARLREIISALLSGDTSSVQDYLKDEGFTA